MRIGKLSPTQLDEAAQLREAGLTIGQLALRYKCSPGLMSWQMLKCGADPESLSGRVLPQTRPGPVEVRRGDHVVRAYLPFDDDVILRLAGQNLSASEIGRALSPPRMPNSIRGRLMTLARHEARREAAEEGRRA